MEAGEEAGSPPGACAAAILGVARASIPCRGRLGRFTSPGKPMRNPYLSAATDEARKGLAAGGMPIGSLLVDRREIIGRGPNQRV